MSSEPAESIEPIEPIETDERETDMAYDKYGEPKGAALFLNADELAELGLSIEDTNGSIRYRVDDGSLRFE